MGVPALFRWLSRKYPKIVEQVQEEHPTVLPGSDGDVKEIPVDISRPNPNGEEFDCLYLDMNGIVHPCTHPEGKPAPESEAEMMIEIFKYTERVVNMVRPRKLLFMAIDGVAPRAKMNQQRSRRFRAAQDAELREKERQIVIAEWEAMGKQLDDEYKNKHEFDSNVITPGTKFMDLLASSLRYWVAKKMNQDSAWSNLQVIISDASVPGEGEHKIMDFIRKERSQPSHNPNTRHVIYGLDADLIMLSLATHEPYFRVLREDVFGDNKKKGGCHRCGVKGHHSNNCTAELPVKKEEDDEEKKKKEKKPFIFLDVSVLREYLYIELNLPVTSFQPNIEQAIDDWIMLIFFVGNDFLPHLPSLEIREGAIDTLLTIWKTNLDKMGGYVTDNGQINLSRLQVILDGLSQREDSIFQKRREAEERQDSNAKRRRIAEDTEVSDLSKLPLPQHQQQHQLASSSSTTTTATSTYNNTESSTPSTADLPPKVNPTTLSTTTTTHPQKRNELFINSKKTQSVQKSKANMSAAEKMRAELNSKNNNNNNTEKANTNNVSAAARLKAELIKEFRPPPSGVANDPSKKKEDQEAKKTAEDSQDQSQTIDTHQDDEEVKKSESQEGKEEEGEEEKKVKDQQEGKEEDIKTEKEQEEKEEKKNGEMVAESEEVKKTEGQEDQKMDVEPSTPIKKESDKTETSPSSGTKRKADEADIPYGRDNEVSHIKDYDPDEEVEVEDEEVPQEVGFMNPPPLKMLGDNVVEQEDTVRLWEHGYKGRYYKQKFGVDVADEEFKTELVKKYVEGLCWVLAYYYQGCPSWRWFYPYHFPPFASDFVNISKFDIKFEMGTPFKPFEQLMGVFPPASRKNIPSVLSDLMVEKDSEILDFYPTDFKIDMNGKKMLWQGIALLPFIDEKRLLDALGPRWDKLDDDEKERNSPGTNTMFINEDHPLYASIYEPFYKSKNPIKVIQLDQVQLDRPDLERRLILSGSVEKNPLCVPRMTLDSPPIKEIETKDDDNKVKVISDEVKETIYKEAPDIANDRSISMVYDFPPQSGPHKSVLLNGIVPPRAVLSSADREYIIRGGRGPQENFHTQQRYQQGFAGSDGPRRPPPYQSSYQPHYNQSYGHQQQGGYQYQQGGYYGYQQSQSYRPQYQHGYGYGYGEQRSGRAPPPYPIEGEDDYYRRGPPWDQQRQYQQRQYGGYGYGRGGDYGYGHQSYGGRGGRGGHRGGYGQPYYQQQAPSPRYQNTAYRPQPPAHGHQGGPPPANRGAPGRGGWSNQQSLSRQLPHHLRQPNNNNNNK